VRNIIGQPKSSFNIRQIMDERKILIVNLSRGLIGEDNASLLGALLVTKIQLAAMSRADIPAEQRSPFYLYVDEFQNFATDSFATILSEARKYGLSLTVANQYIAQMSMSVKDAVFGNVGSIIAFRMSADDARTMTRYFEPKFTEYDLVHMHNRHFAISMTIGGEKVPAFSAISLNLPPFATDYSAEIIAHSRSQYAQSRDSIERYVAEHYLTTDTAAAKQAQPKVTQPQSLSPQREAPVAPKPLPAPVKAETPKPATLAPRVTPPVSALSHAVLSQIVADADAAGGDKPKRKRTRKRKKRPNDNPSASVAVAVDIPPPAPAAPSPQSKSGILGEEVIHLN